MDELIEKRSKLMTELEGLDDLDQRGELTDDQEKRHASLIKEIADVDADIAQKRNIETERKAAREKRSKAYSDLKGAGKPERRFKPSGSKPPKGDEDVESRDEGLPDLAEYSIMRAIYLKSEGRAVDGLEGEVHQELCKRKKDAPSGVLVPQNLMLERRAFNTTTGAGFKQEILRMTMIDALRAKMLVSRLGATILGDLVGKVSIPKGTGLARAYWFGEGDAVTESNAVVGKVTLDNHHLGARSEITRSMIKQTSWDVEQYTRMMIMLALALELDRAALNGSGEDDEPEGVLQNADVPTIAIGANGGAPTQDLIIDMETSIEDNNADLSTLAYLTSAVGKGKLKKTKIEAGQTDKLWQNSEMNGYQAFATTQIPKNLTKGTSNQNLTAILFGDFSNILVGLWGPIDLVINPFSKDAYGSVILTAIQDADVQLKHAKGFSRIADVDYGAPSVA